MIPSQRSRYEVLEPISRSSAASEIASGDPARIGVALLQLVLFDPDGEWLRALVAEHLRHESGWVRGIAATCASHLARLHRDLDVTSLEPPLRDLLRDPEAAGKAEDALGDFDVFRRRPPRS